MEYIRMDVKVEYSEFGESILTEKEFDSVSKVCIKLPRSGAAYEISTDNGQLRIRSETDGIITLGQYLFD